MATSLCQQDLGVFSYRIYERGWFKSPFFGILFLAATPFYWKIEHASGFSPAVENPLWVIYYILTVIGIPSLFETTKRWTWDRILGDLSYPIYIVHILVMALIDHFLGRAVYERIGVSGWLALNVGAVILVAAALNVFIATPIDRFRLRLAARNLESTQPGLSQSPPNAGPVSSQ